MTTRRAESSKVKDRSSKLKLALFIERTKSLQELVRKGDDIMQQIEITDEALPILKSGIALKKKLLTAKADGYLNLITSLPRSLSST